MGTDEADVEKGLFAAGLQTISFWFILISPELSVASGTQ